MPELALLLDDGGVLNDNALRGPKWQQLIGEFFVPILGGKPAAWAQANREVMERLFEPTAWNALLESAPDYASFERQYYSIWLGGMCELVGLPPLPEEQCVELGATAEAFVTPRAHAAFPGAVEAIRALHADGYELHTASGESSVTLSMYLGGLGLQDCFGRLYGPDLINTHKNGPAYYQRLLADLGLPPHWALFVDDSPKALSWAAQAGPRTMLVGRREDAAFQQIGSLAELQSAIAKYRS
jgi:HAD superfamily hydrolase (TIGR01509 family)